MYRAVFVLVAVVASAQTVEPRAGVLLASGGFIKELLGVPGSLVPGKTLASDAVAAVTCGEALVVKTGSTIVFGEAEFDAPVGEAILGFNHDCLTAVAYFPASAQFASITSTGIDVLPIDASLVNGEVLAVGSRLRVLVRRNGEVHDLKFRGSDGALESDKLLGVNPDLAVMSNDDSIVYVTGTRIVVQDRDGVERSAESPLAVTGLMVASEGLIQIRTSGLSLALKIRPDRLDLTYIPEAAQ